MNELLFVCVHNSGRSQMAKALFNSLAEAQGLPWRADSAGTQPAERVNPTVVEGCTSWAWTYHGNVRDASLIG